MVKSLKIPGCPSEAGGGARHEVNARALFDANDVMSGASILKKSLSVKRKS